MGYVPPHLRNGSGPATSSGGSAPSSSSYSSDRGGSYSRTGDSFSRGGGSYSRGGDSYDRRPGGFGGKDSYSDRDRQSSGRPAADRETAAVQPKKPTAGPSAAASPQWKPSARVLALTAEQIEETRKRLNVNVEEGSSGGGAASSIAPIESFDDMNLDSNIMLDIRQREYQSPTPIQAQGIPVALSGRDILGCAETGSGKTASFAIPMIQHCLNSAPIKRGDGPIGLVLAPTRELAQQIEREVQAFSRTSKSVRAAIVVGGVNMGEQRGDLRAGVEIVVATPGRFIDHLQQRNTALNRVAFVVLDEADRMLDMGFEPQIRDVMQALPAGHQTLLFSATMPPEIEGLANEYLTKPIRVKVGQVSTPTANVTQSMQKTTDAQKIDDCVAMLLDEEMQAQKNGHSMPLTIVFVERKLRCDDVADALRQEGLNAAALHGGLSQGERMAALADFTSSRIQVLVATDVASRGLDIKGIGHVINLDLPHTFEDYVHRIGRTGRAGATGRATSFYTDRDSFLVSQIKKAIQELESGNASAFQTGKAARQREREAALEFKEKLKLGASNIVETGEGVAVNVVGKYAFMANTESSKTGAADDAWDD